MLDTPQMEVINSAMLEVRQLNDEIAPISAYYLGSPIRRLAQALHLSPQPDFRKYNSELAVIDARARSCVDAANEALEQLGELNRRERRWPIEIQQTVQTCQTQVYCEATALICFCLYVRSKADGDAATARTALGAVREMTAKADANRRHFSRPPS